MSDQAFINGFLKRAADYGVSEDQAIELLSEKSAGLGGLAKGLAGGLAKFAPSAIGAGSKAVSGLGGLYSRGVLGLDSVSAADAARGIFGKFNSMNSGTSPSTTQEHGLSASVQSDPRSAGNAVMSAPVASAGLVPTNDPKS